MVKSGDFTSHVVRDKDNRKVDAYAVDKRDSLKEGDDDGMKQALDHAKSAENNEQTKDAASGVEQDINKESSLTNKDTENNTQPHMQRTSPTYKKKAKVKVKQKSRSSMKEAGDAGIPLDNNFGSSLTDNLGHVLIETAKNSFIPNKDSTTEGSTATTTITRMSPPTKANNITKTTITNNTTITTTTNANTAQDKMQKLKFLKDLYDQGFITVVEFKERKSQIIDELTGTKTTTRTNSSHIPIRMSFSLIFICYIYYLFIYLYNIEPPTVVASPPPDWSTIREETALKHVYDTVKNQWTTTVVKVCITALSSISSIVTHHLSSSLHCLFHHIFGLLLSVGKTGRTTIRMWRIT